MFVKKSPAGYLSIVDSYYDPQTKTNRHKTVQKVGSRKALIQQGISDPDAYADQILAELKAKRAKEKAATQASTSYAKIGEACPFESLGQYFIRAIDNCFDLVYTINLFGKASVQKRAEAGEILQDLVVARILDPNSKKKTFTEVIPTLKKHVTYSLDDIYSALEFFGLNYKRIVAWYRDQYSTLFGIDSSYTFFDTTNFYFEIDRQDDLRRKGPSKEHRPDPIVGMGLLLDAHLIPINMVLYPGNESEKPKFKEVLCELKHESSIKGKTIRVADKGLNCAQNIYDAIQVGDGYIFSKSIKGLAEKERAWALAKDGFKAQIDPYTKDCIGEIKSVVDTFEYKDSHTHKVFKVKEKRVVSLNFALRKKQLQEIDKMVEKSERLRVGGAKRSEFGECAKFVTFKVKGSDDGEVEATLNEAAIEKARACAGYNMIVTSETYMDALSIYATYHQLWRIEETFRTLKTFLDARLVYLQRPERIKGHFLVCYIAILVTRILQFIYLNNKFGTPEIIEFLRGLKVLEVGSRTFRNLSSRTSLGDYIASHTHLKVDKATPTLSEINAIRNLKFKIPKQRVKKGAK